MIVKHYAGDDTDVNALVEGILAAFDGISVEDYEAQARRNPFTSGTAPAVRLCSPQKRGWTTTF